MISSTLWLCCSNDSQRCWMTRPNTNPKQKQSQMRCKLQKAEAAALELQQLLGREIHFSANTVQQEATILAC